MWDQVHITITSCILSLTDKAVVVTLFNNKTNALFRANERKGSYII